MGAVSVSNLKLVRCALQLSSLRGIRLPLHEDLGEHRDLGAQFVRIPRAR